MRTKDSLSWSGSSRSFWFRASAASFTRSCGCASPWPSLALPRALASIVISVFMAGLGLGSWGSGRLIRNYESRVRVPALRIYALAELLIGISALLVPYQLLYGRKLLEWTGASSSWAYYLDRVSGSLSPWFRGAPAWERRYRWPCLRSAAGIQSGRSDHSAISTCPTCWAR